MIIVEILAPIILIVVLGTVLRHSGFASEAFFRETNRLVYWIALPGFLFLKTSQATPQFGAAARVFAALVAGMAACIVLGLLAGRLLRLERPSLASFVQGAYRSNLAYVGLPIVIYALAAMGQDTPETEAVALLAIAPLIPVYNVVAVLVLLSGRQDRSLSLTRQAGMLAQGVATNPLIIACVAGVAFAYTGWVMPLAVERALEAIGQMALPLALLGIGATLRAWAIREGGIPALASAVIKTAVAPLVGYMLARAFRLSSVETLMVLLYIAMPTAVMSYVMAERLGANGRLAGSIVVMSTLLALPALAVILLSVT
jgi:hypothetical protein